jgi:hypothetical protein
MPFYFIAIIGAPLFLSALWSQQRFQEVHDLERAIIGLDNASIQLGRSARKVWNGLSQYHTWLSPMENVHHLWHLCARQPLLGVKCRAGDLAWEFFLQRGRDAAWAWAQKGWSQGVVQAHLEGQKQKILLSLSRSQAVPIRVRRCSVCGLSLRFEISAPQRLETSSAVWRQRTFKNRVFWLGKNLEGEKWNYRVEGGTGVD